MSHLSSPELLFVDDETMFAQGYVCELEKRYSVTLATTVPYGERLIKQSHNFACAVIDVMMPIPSDWPTEDAAAAGQGIHTGVVLIRRCRKAILEAALPIVILTNRNPQDVEVEVATLGFPNELIVVRHKVNTMAPALVNVVRSQIQVIKRANT